MGIDVSECCQEAVKWFHNASGCGSMLEVQSKASTYAQMCLYAVSEVGFDDTVPARGHIHCTGLLLAAAYMYIRTSEVLTHISCT